MSGAIVTADEPTRANVKSLPGPDGDMSCHGAFRVDQSFDVYGNLNTHTHTMFSILLILTNFAIQIFYHTSLATRGSVRDLDTPGYGASGSDVNAIPPACSPVVGTE